MKSTLSNMRWSAVVALVATGCLASATVFINDTEFVATDWQEDTLYMGGATVTSNAFQTTFFGNPAPARMHLVTVDGGQVDLLAMHHFIPTNLDPSAVTLNTIRMSASLFANSPGEYSFMIIQDNQTFLSGWNLETGGVVTTESTGILQAVDFGLLFGLGGLIDPFTNPDFSGNGAPMMFGVAFRETIDGSNGLVSRAYQIDNFVAEYNPVPEPMTLVGFGIAAFVGTRAKRRKV